MITFRAFLMKIDARDQSAESNVQTTGRLRQPHGDIGQWELRGVNLDTRDEIFDVVTRQYADITQDDLLEPYFESARLIDWKSPMSRASERPEWLGVRFGDEFSSVPGVVGKGDHFDMARRTRIVFGRSARLVMSSVGTERTDSSASSECSSCSWR